MSLISDIGPSASAKAAYTSSTPATKTDETVIGEIVAEAALPVAETAPLPWANGDTGSAGVVTEIAAQTVGKTQCRDFTATSHTFKGIAKYYGQTCAIDAGNWQITRFEKQE